MRFIPVQAGCLTFVIAGIALMIGISLDARLGTAPRWMLISLLASVPFTLGGIYLIVRRTLRKPKVDPERNKHGQQENDNTET